MQPYQGQERRKVQRTKLVTFCPVHFEFENKTYEAMMVDVSERGARFTIESLSVHLDMPLGQELAYSVKTPYGSSECKGKAVWGRTIEGLYNWGVSFTQLSSDEKDPLRCLIDNPF